MHANRSNTLCVGTRKYLSIKAYRIMDRFASGIRGTFRLKNLSEERTNEKREQAHRPCLAPGASRDRSAGNPGNCARIMDNREEFALKESKKQPGSRLTSGLMLPVRTRTARKSSGRLVSAFLLIHSQEGASARTGTPWSRRCKTPTARKERHHCYR